MRKLFIGLLIALGIIGLAGAAVYAYYSNILTLNVNADRGLSLIYTDVQSNTAGNYSWTPTNIDTDLYGGEWLAFDADLENKANHTFLGMTYEVEVINWATLSPYDLYLEYDDGSGDVNMSLCTTDVYHMYGYVNSFDVNPMSLSSFNVNMQLNESIGPGTYAITTKLIKDAQRAC